MIPGDFVNPARPEIAAAATAANLSEARGPSAAAVRSSVATAVLTTERPSF
jgi:hypothetical protein